MNVFLNMNESPTYFNVNNAAQLAIMLCHTVIVSEWWKAQCYTWVCDGNKKDQGNAEGEKERPDDALKKDLVVSASCVSTFWAHS